MQALNLGSSVFFNRTVLIRPFVPCLEALVSRVFILSGLGKFCSMVPYQKVTLAGIAIRREIFNIALPIISS